jgi:acyl-ACP thioesterase
VVVETWPKGVSRLFALRDFVVRTAAGTDAVRATSAWLTLDVESKRPRRPQEIMRQEVMLEGEHAIAEMPGKLRLPAELEVADTRTARYSDLDVNRHVNNARYVDWLFDALPPAEDALTPFSELTVQFTGESRYGQRLEVRTAPVDSEERVYASIVSRDDGESVFEAAIGIPRE